MVYRLGMRNSHSLVSSHLLFHSFDRSLILQLDAGDAVETQSQYNIKKKTTNEPFRLLLHAPLSLYMHPCP